MTKKKTTSKKPVKKVAVPVLEETLENTIVVYPPSELPRKRQSEQGENQSQQSG